MGDVRNIDPSTLAGWLVAHQWAPVVAFVALVVVRLLRADTKLPGQLTEWARPYAALVLSWAGSELVAYLSHTGGAAAATHTAVTFGIATIAQHAASSTRAGDVPLPKMLLKAPVVPALARDTPPPPPPMAA